MTLPDGYTTKASATETKAAVNGKPAAEGTLRASDAFRACEWPAPLHGISLVGPLGEAVRLIEPHSESDPAAILFQLLIGYGSLVGRYAYWHVEADRHGCGLFGVLVGQTGKGRKGTSWGHAKSVLSVVDRGWAMDCQASGLASGEGLISAINDPTTTCAESAESVDDEDQGDKRLMVVEPEFSRVLRVCRREGNTLSSVIRQAWDGDTLRVMTRHQPLKATGAHISIVAHITEEELGRELTDTDTLNGFANRFLWVVVRRSKRLPFGGQFHQEDIAPITRRLRRSAVEARHRGRVEMSADARRLWEWAYDGLSADAGGLYGAAVGRAEPQVMRLALVYALSMNSPVIDEDHLAAALEAWRYSDDSARYLFGAATGDQVADRIARFLVSRLPRAASRTEIRGLFGGHVTADRITAALDLLASRGVAVRVDSGPTGGRPAEYWRAGGSA